ncbi:MAG: hypothetical protein ACYCY9_15685 [Thiobacillus sp.]
MPKRQVLQSPLGENLQRGTMPRMRRFIALIIMIIVPLQFAWSAAAGLHGHMGQNVAAQGLHAHDHDYHDAGHANHGATNGGMDNDHNKDEHHGGHCHHVLSLILPESGLIQGLIPSGGRILHPHATFFTRTPPLLDRPPLASA